MTLSASPLATERPVLQSAAASTGDNRVQERWVLESLDSKTYGIAMSGSPNNSEVLLCPSWSSNDVVLRPRGEACNCRPWQIDETSPGRYTISAMKLNPEGIPDGKWAVRIEGEETIDITFSGDSFEAFGSKYVLDRTASPMTITWSDGTLQTVKRIEDCTVEWTTTCEDYPIIIWELIDRPDAAGTATLVGERLFLTSSGDGKVVLSPAAEGIASNQVWMLDRLFAESLTSETVRFNLQVERLAASAWLALAEGRLDDALAYRDAHAKVHEDCGLPMAPVIELRTEISLGARGRETCDKKIATSTAALPSS